MAAINLTFVSNLVRKQHVDSGQFDIIYIQTCLYTFIYQDFPSTLFFAFHSVTTDSLVHISNIRLTKGFYLIDSLRLNAK
jgi:hypothetical protein